MVEYDPEVSWNFIEPFLLKTALTFAHLSFKLGHMMAVLVILQVLTALEDAQTHFQQYRWLSIALIIINISQRMCFRHSSEKKIVLVAKMSMHGTFFALQKSKNNGRPQNLVGKTSEVDF